MRFMHGIRLGLLTVFLLFLILPTLSFSFPNKPIKLVVYTKPGGAIDIFARRFQQIAQKYTSATIVVENKPGAGGLVALNYVARQGSDGHVLAAVTKSNIGKITSAQSQIQLSNFHWLSMLVADPECIIVSTKGRLKNWADLIKDAKEKNGNQLWVGPAAGGNDHIMAQKTWKLTQIQAKWIPYAGGGNAMVDLMGGHGDVYVGNPGDVIGKPDLKIVAVSNPKRLSAPFADVPTFKELGIEGLDEEILWRGFITQKGISEEAVSFYEDLISKVSEDADWKSYIEKSGAETRVLKNEEFLKVAQKDHQEFLESLKELQILK